MKVAKANERQEQAMKEKQQLKEKLNQYEDEMRSIIENLDMKEQTIAKLKEKEEEMASKFEKEINFISTGSKYSNIKDDEEADRAEDERLARIMKDVEEYQKIEKD